MKVNSSIHLLKVEFYILYSILFVFVYIYISFLLIHLSAFFMNACNLWENALKLQGKANNFQAENNLLTNKSSFLGTKHVELRRILLPHEWIIRNSYKYVCINRKTPSPTFSRAYISKKDKGNFSPPLYLSIL